MNHLRGIPRRRRRRSGSRSRRPAAFQLRFRQTLILPRKFRSAHWIVALWRRQNFDVEDSRFRGGFRVVWRLLWWVKCSLHKETISWLFGHLMFAGFILNLQPLSTIAERCFYNPTTHHCQCSEKILLRTFTLIIPRVCGSLHKIQSKLFDLPVAVAH